jgi:hypothetical protein
MIMEDMKMVGMNMEDMIMEGNAMMEDMQDVEGMMEEEKVDVGEEDVEEEQTDLIINFASLYF